MTSPTVNVLVERAGDWWIAKFLQLRMSTQAKTLTELMVEIERYLFTHMLNCLEQGIEPFEDRPVSDDVWHRYRTSPELRASESLEFQVEPDVLRVHRDARSEHWQRPKVEARISA